jgi:hypothetical protein
MMDAIRQCKQCNRELGQNKRKQICEVCKKERRRKYDKNAKETIKGVRDRLKSRLRKHKGIMYPGAATTEWTKAILERWENRCVITGQTTIAKLDVIPFRGFKPGVPVPAHEWVVVTLGQSMALSHIREMEERLAKFPLHVQLAISAAAAEVNN